jgi:hypothetical protein
MLEKQKKVTINNTVLARSASYLCVFAIEFTCDRQFSQTRFHDKSEREIYFYSAS